jgi:DNA polymerase III epsilon subunit-like protein
MNIEGIMIDVETLGTQAGCSILSIGACEFTSKGVGKQYYEVIDPESCAQWGLTIELRTVMWWMEQNQQARDSLTRARKTPLDVALKGLINGFKWKGKRVWCNGANFDFPILEAGFRAVGFDVPWDYWATCDYRTLKGLVSKDTYNGVKIEPTISHNALADAVAQAETAIRLGLCLAEVK